jgi:hypothetical protein
MVADIMEAVNRTANHHTKVMLIIKKLSPVYAGFFVN